MSVALCTLCLNEMEWLPKLYQQHKGWPTMERWVFVEAADAMYQQANPHMVSRSGLSVDGTTEFLEDLAKQDERVIHIPYGISRDSDPAQGKCAARQEYLNAIEDLAPNMFVALDADEFWTYQMQQEITEISEKTLNSYQGVSVQYRNIWRPPTIQDQPLFESEIIGGFWSVWVCKIWRWGKGITYLGNHNSPRIGMYLLHRNLMRLDKKLRTPQFVHMGFASSLPETRKAKNRYYVERGEGRTDHRGIYVASRAAYETWKPGDKLPNGDRIIMYSGPVPECF